VLVHDKRDERLTLILNIKGCVINASMNCDYRFHDLFASQSSCVDGEMSRRTLQISAPSSLRVLLSRELDVFFRKWYPPIFARTYVFARNSWSVSQDEVTGSEASDLTDETWQRLGVKPHPAAKIAVIVGGKLRSTRRNSQFRSRTADEAVSVDRRFRRKFRIDRNESHTFIQLYRKRKGRAREKKKK